MLKFRNKNLIIRFPHVLAFSFCYGIFIYFYYLLINSISTNFKTGINFNGVDEGWIEVVVFSIFLILSTWSFWDLYKQSKSMEKNIK
jgi:hypothetical protein